MTFLHISKCYLCTLEQCELIVMFFGYKRTCTLSISQKALIVWIGRLTRHALPTTCLRRMKQKIKKRNLVNLYDNDMRDKDETEKKKDLVNRYDWDRRNEKVKLNDLFVTNIGNGNIWNGGYITYVAASCLQTPHAPTQTKPPMSRTQDRRVW